MYNQNDIVIVGDSFCSHRSERDSWPQLVMLQLTGNKFKSGVEPRGKGFAGGAWWSYRKVLLEELKIRPCKVLVICHTEPFRIPNDNDYSLNFKSVEDRVLHIDNDDYKMPVNLAMAAVGYYKELMSNDFCLWAVQQWFLELDKICTEHNIEKVIHLYCFEGSYTNYTFNNGVTISLPLCTYQEEARPYFWRFKSRQINHYSIEGNFLFAKKVVELIENYPGNNIRLNIKMVNYGTS
jgi:hypothetical protein